MRCRLIIGEDWQQVVLHPETEHEKKILSTVSGGFKKSSSYKATVSFGSYFEERCQGGWYRQYEKEDSLMVTLEKPDDPQQV